MSDGPLSTRDAPHPPSPSPDAAGHLPLPSDHLQRVDSWGRNIQTIGYVYRPSDVEGIREVFALAHERGLTVALRGGGNSYGDASQNREELVLDLTRMNRILAWDRHTGVMTCEPGVTLRQVWQHAIEDGYWPYVVSGTMFPTMGGAAAMNIHGKNHVKAGTLGEHIREFDFLLPSGEIRHCSRDENTDLFHAAIGGFGVLGVFTRITLELMPVHSGLLRVTSLAASNWREMFQIVDERIADADYLVGWVDCFATGEAAGRGLVNVAHYLKPGEDPAPARTLRVESQELGDTVLGILPKSLLWRFLRPWFKPRGMRFLNTVQYTLGKRKHGASSHETHASYAFKLDYVPNWKFAYGPHGLIQYQVFVPKESAERVFTEMTTLCQQRNLVPFLSVFKRHRADPFLMSYGGDGYSLALDFPITGNNKEQLYALAGEMDNIVLAAGGRHYFAKDSTLQASRLGALLAEERVQRFLALKKELDPEGILQTDLFRRLFGEAASS
jgi:decaprenylphospho-beta-D-ribofuranose 2-oxidase